MAGDLLVLARAGDAAALAAAIDAGAAADAADPTGWTPLLWAAARGHAAAVDALLVRGADPRRKHPASGALPLHLAGQAGDTATVARLLAAAPDTLEAALEVNGHTVLLQAVFYGRLELARMLVERGADCAAVTARGLGPVELAAQFQNAAMGAILAPHDRPAAEKAENYRRYLARIAPQAPPWQREAQARADRLVAAVETGLKRAATDEASAPGSLAAVRELVEEAGADIDRLGGPLSQTPLIVAATGNDGFPPNPAVRALRFSFAEMLLAAGADPTAHEKHPMGVQTVIRAAVFNHLKILRLCAEACAPAAFADAINEQPAVNGLTAMHDSVLRCGMAEDDVAEGYLEQIAFFVRHGGRSDIEDYSGVTQRALADRARTPERRRRILAALDA